MQIVCKDLKQHEMMVNELQDVEGEKNFFLADPGRACYKFSKKNFHLLFFQVGFGTTPLVIVTVNMELYG